MCFHMAISKKAQELKHRFKADFLDEQAFKPAIYNGFEHPKTPVITKDKPENIQLFEWGLIPHWAKDKDIQKYTLNARVETITEKPSFRDVVQQRCLVLADCFFEWQWLDPKGKNKQKYQIKVGGDEAFAIAGLYSEWLDRSTGELLNTYTILTTEAMGIMRNIHNSKLRMPIILPKNKEVNWLMGEDLHTSEMALIAEKI